MENGLFLIRTKKIDLRLNVLIFQQKPSQMFLFGSYLKPAFYALLAVYLISKLIFIFSVLHLLVAFLTGKQILTSLLVLCNRWLKMFHVLKMFLKNG